MHLEMNLGNKNMMKKIKSREKPMPTVIIIENLAVSSGSNFLNLSKSTLYLALNLYSPGLSISTVIVWKFSDITILGSVCLESIIAYFYTSPLWLGS